MKKLASIKDGNQDIRAKCKQRASENGFCAHFVPFHFAFRTPMILDYFPDQPVFKLAVRRMSEQ